MEQTEGKIRLRKLVMDFKKYTKEEAENWVDCFEELLKKTKL